MKLQTRTNLNYILFSGITYIIVAVSFYIAIERVIYEEVDRRLLVEKRDFEHFIERNGSFDTRGYFVEDKIDVQVALSPRPIYFGDTLLLSRYDSQLIPFRQVSFDQKIGDELHRVNIRKSLIESDQLLKIITLVMLIVLCAGLFLLYVFQQRTSRKLWQPFYETLGRAKDFNVHQGERLILSPQMIYEFNELNIALNKMTDKILSDYQNLREFTENASHEIQTPLALINSRVEALIQDSGISGMHVAWIQDIHEATMRLSKLNHALLLLAKIENGQFQDAAFLDMKKIVESHLIGMEEMFALKSITVQSNLIEPFMISMNPVLADILITNLLNNVVKHSTKGGTTTIDLTSTRLSISNQGTLLTVDPLKLFERFQKENKATSSLGLGLAIVRKICEISNLRINYEYKEGVHTLTLDKYTQS
ncbi:MAG: HAMP domain-containing histidine kinase [Cyclobacteriaceae bacterium]|nr:HAMP domain-containing histidine kinase [Cyclobacteriaceae bacterium]